MICICSVIQGIILTGHKPLRKVKLKLGASGPSHSIHQTNPTPASELFLLVKGMETRYQERCASLEKRLVDIEAAIAVRCKHKGLR
jgi:hypothetical protein